MIDDEFYGSTMPLWNNYLSRYPQWSSAERSPSRWWILPLIGGSNRVGQSQVSAP